MWIFNNVEHVRKMLKVMVDGNQTLSNVVQHHARWAPNEFNLLEEILCRHHLAGALVTIKGSVQQKSPHSLSHLNTSCCRFVYVWDTNSRRILYKLPGHDGSVNDVDFHPNELICEYIQDFNLYAIYKFTKFLKLVILLIH